jgi:hypothetical protein
MVMNLDKILSRAVLHDEHCVYVPKTAGSSVKPVGQMGRDGGWFRVKSEAEATELATSLLPGVTVKHCPRC